MVEYLANCNACHKHTIIETVKSIAMHKTHRLLKCGRCGKVNRMTIIGTVEKPKIESTAINPEYSTSNKLVFKFWD